MNVTANYAKFTHMLLIDKALHNVSVCLNAEIATESGTGR